MSADAASRRGGSLGVTLGYLGVAGSAVVLLAAGPRVLGAEAFSGLAIAWTLSTVVGLGLATPTEQVMTRRLNAGTAGVLRPFGWLAGWVLVLAGPLALAGVNLPLTRSFPQLDAAMVTACLGWVLACWVRGNLAGRGDLSAYAWVLLTESVCRLIAVAVAVTQPRWAADVLALAIGAPMIASAVAGAIFLRHAEFTQRVEAPAPDHEHLSFAVMSVAYQVCLNGPPLLLGWRLGTSRPAAIGAFVAASTYLRAPSLLVGGISTHALVSLSHAWASKDAAAFVSGLRSLLWRTATVSGLATLVALAASPWVLPLYYGKPTSLPPVLLIGLALSTLMAIAGAVGVAPLFAAERGTSAAVAWAIGAVLTAALVTLAPGLGAATAAGLVVGPASAAMVIFLLVRNLVRGAPAARVE